MKFNKSIKNIVLGLIYQIFRNKFLFSASVIYAALLLSIIDWGMPGPSHPFTYHMDEWHQLEAVRSTFKYLSPNIPGSAHGTMFHFILSGIYLIPFFLLGIINPFFITSPVESLEMQRRIFEILRLNTLFLGLLSIFFIAKIAKKYFKLNPIIPVILFAVTPLWLALSNYFKYDIALIFWIIISLYYLLEFGSKPNLKNYLISGAFCSLAVATKISALPLFIAYIISFFWFQKRERRKFINIYLGLLVFFIIFILFGIPDMLFGKGDWSEFLYSNLISGSNGYDNLLTGFSAWWQYLFFKILPIDFGYSFFIIYMLGIAYWVSLFVKKFLTKRSHLFKNEFFLLFCFLLFTLSLMPLKLGANGNRLLVLLPFFALLSGSFLQRVRNTLLNFKFLFSILITLIIIVQFYQSIIMVYVKWLPDVRRISSDWMKKNLKKKTLIGIENIPIYQMLPDIVVKDFYSKDKVLKYQTYFNYQVIDASSKTIPSIVIVVGKELDLRYLKKSPKRQLIKKLMGYGYKEIIEFNPPQALYFFSGNPLNYITSGLAPISAISIFEKVN